MDPKFKTSFIPKSPLVNSPKIETSVYKPKTISVFSIICVVVFMASVLVSGFIFVSISREKNKINKINEELALAKQAFEPEVVKELITISNQMASVKDLINKHIAVSNLFYLIESITIKNISFNSFRFERGQNGINVSLEGEALSYGHASKQAGIFTETGFIKDVSFSSLKLTDLGTVQINMEMQVDTSSISYTEAIKRLSFLNQINN